MQKNKRNTQSTRPPQIESRKDPARIDYYIQEAKKAINILHELKQVTDTRFYNNAMVNASEADRVIFQGLIIQLQVKAAIVGDITKACMHNCEDHDAAQVDRSDYEEMCGYLEPMTSPAGFDDF